MALFDTFKNKKDQNQDTSSKKEVSASSAKKTSPQKSAAKKVADKTFTPGSARIDQGAKGGERYGHVIVRPRITEKASLSSGKSAYTFDVHPDATKPMIAHAIREIYNVTPVKVNIITRKPKRVMVRGKRGMKSGGKKAIVFLGGKDKIEFV